MIRVAAISDMPRVVEMGLRFLGQGEYSNLISPNKSAMEDTAAKLIDAGWVLVVEKNGQLVGMIGFVIHRHFLSAEMVAGEVFWWVEPEHRGVGLDLMREAERRARAAGAKKMQMISPNKLVDRLYKSSGYQFVESTYQKEL